MPIAEQDQAEWNAYRAKDGTPGADVSTFLGDDLQPDECHSERPATDGDGVGEIDEQPDPQRDRGDDLGVRQGDVPAEQRRQQILDDAAAEREERGRHQDIDGECRHPRDDAGVVALQADVAVGFES